MKFLIIIIFLFNSQQILKHTSSTELSDTIYLSHFINLEGLELGADGFISEAENRFKKALRLHSSNREAKLNLRIVEDYETNRLHSRQIRDLFMAALNYKHQRYTPALKTIGDLSKEIPEYYPLLVYSALLFLKTASFQQGILAITRAIEIEGENPYSWFIRGQIAYADSDYNSSVDDFTQAILLDTRYDAAYLRRGLTYRKIKSLDLAITDFERAMSLNPVIASLLEESLQIFETFNNRGIQNIEKGRYEDAVSDFERAISINSLFSEPFINLGNAYRHLNDYERALLNYSRAELIDQQNPEIYLNRGLTYVKMNKYDKARSDFDKVVQFDESHSGAYFQIGEILHKTGEYEDAIYYFKKTIESNPSEFWAYYMMAISYDNIKRYEKAIEAYIRFTEKAPDSFYEHRLKATERVRRLRKWLNRH
jgi:tetratricopeptide (TPR) repeat protein